jgi:hypothetical protein
MGRSHREAKDIRSLNPSLSFTPAGSVEAHLILSILPCSWKITAAYLMLRAATAGPRPLRHAISSRIGHGLDLSLTAQETPSSPSHLFRDGAALPELSLAFGPGPSLSLLTSSSWAAPNARSAAPRSSSRTMCPGYRRTMSHVDRRAKGLCSGM